MTALQLRIAAMSFFAWREETRKVVPVLRTMMKGNQSHIDFMTPRKVSFAVRYDETRGRAIDIPICDEEVLL